MGDTLGKFVRSVRKLDTRVTNQNKDEMIKEMNKWSNTFDIPKLNKNSNVREVNHAKKIYMDELGYSMLNLAVEQGNTVIASTYNETFKKSEDSRVKKIAEYSPQLSQAKRFSDKKLSKQENKYLEDGNENIKGYGNEGIIKLFEKTKSKKAIEKLIDQIKTQNPKADYYDSKLTTFERVFQKVELYREDDLNKLKAHLKKLDFEKLTNATNYLLTSLEIYGSPKNATGAYGDEETELANARLDDMLIQLEINKTGKQKVKKILNKYK
jgi:hypothetical protein